MPQQAIHLCRKATEYNTACPLRKGNIIHLPDHGKAIVAGDLHGHRRNFERIVHFADLPNNPDTHVVLQEIIHGGPEDDYGGCLSYRLLLDALEIQLKFPNQVHILLGNHDTAVVSNTSVLKAGREMNLAMKTAMRRHYKTQFDEVEKALVEYLMSQPLAVRCHNRIWISHSLPADEYAHSFDTGIFERHYRMEDIQRSNAVYQLTWGRRHSQETLDVFARKLDCDVFVLGHQPQDEGFTVAGNNCLIIASEHNFGCILSFDLAKHYDAATLGCQGVVQLAAIA